MSIVKLIDGKCRASVECRVNSEYRVSVELMVSVVELTVSVG